VLAEGGVGDGCVHEPDDLAVEEAECDRRSRVAVLDRDAERVQVFNLEGRCHGAFESLRPSG
jgi:hypothetical protein